MSSDPNLNAQVLASLNRLADKVAILDETKTNSASCAIDGDDDELLNRTAAMNIADNDTDETDDFGAQLKAVQPFLSTILPSTPISHWRTLPPEVQSAYQLLNDGASYIHATSTKYTLISNTGHTPESGNLAVELRKGAELLGTGALLLFSESCGSSRSVKHYVKLHVRAVVASVVSLLQYFEDNSGNDTNNNNNIGAQKTGAVWSACDKLNTSLPRGNRAAMRRELMVWMRDCNESIAEFEELLSLGPNSEEQEDGGDDNEDDEERYTQKEMKLAKASVNLMKCSKNVLNLVMSACECVGDHLEKESDDMKRNEMLRYIAKLHDKARSIGVGVTNFGVLLYPPLDMETDMAEVSSWLLKKKKTILEVTTSSSLSSIPNLGTSTLGLKLECQLHELLDCVESVHYAGMKEGCTCIGGCLSKDVVEASERLLNAVHVRCKEVEEAFYEATCEDKTT